MTSNGPRRSKWSGIETEKDGGGGKSVPVLSGLYAAGRWERRGQWDGGIACLGWGMADGGRVAVVIFVGTHCTRSDG